eukprot:3912051-Alexandrium_andersonii.AAC.1
MPLIRGRRRGGDDSRSVCARAPEPGITSSPATGAEAELSTVSLTTAALAARRSPRATPTARQVLSPQQLALARVK